MHDTCMCLAPCNLLHTHAPSLPLYLSSSSLPFPTTYICLSISSWLVGFVWLVGLVSFSFSQFDFWSLGLDFCFGSLLCVCPLFFSLPSLPPMRPNNLPMKNNSWQQTFPHSQIPPPTPTSQFGFYFTFFSFPLLLLLLLLPFHRMDYLHWTHSLVGWLDWTLVWLGSLLFISFICFSFLLLYFSSLFHFDLVWTYSGAFASARCRSSWHSDARAAQHMAGALLLALLARIKLVVPVVRTV